MSSVFTFDPKSQRYRYKDSGKFVSAEAVRNLSEKYIDHLKTDIGTIVDKLVEGKINVATWEETTARALKDLHIGLYTLGRGGLKQVSARDYGIIGSELKKEYQYLRGFSQDILAGKMSEAQLRDRVSKYVDSSYSTYELGSCESHRSAGYNWERRIRNAAVSCDSCVVYSSRGWQPLGTLPNIGSECECKSRCRCHKEYSALHRRPTDSILSSRFGWVGASFESFPPIFLLLNAAIYINNSIPKS